jgi:phage gp16-like protein
MAPRKAVLAKIHVAKKELGLTDEVYRNLLFMKFQVDSTSSLNDRQATVLLNTFKAKGWKPKLPPPLRERYRQRN